MLENPSAHRPSPTATRTVVLAALSAAVLVAGTFAPWAEMLGVSRSGTDWHAGVVPLATAGVLALVAALARRGAPLRQAAVVAAAGACWTGWKVLDVAHQVHAAGAWAGAWGDLLDDVRPTTGVGLWLALAGCGLTLVLTASVLSGRATRA